MYVYDDTLLLACTVVVVPLCCAGVGEVSYLIAHLTAYYWFRLAELCAFQPKSVVSGRRAMPVAPMPLQARIVNLAASPRIHLSPAQASTHELARSPTQLQSFTAAHANGFLVNRCFLRLGL